MRAKFVRGKEPKSAMGLGMVTISLDYHNFEFDEEKLEDGIIAPDMDDQETVYAIEHLENSGLKYEFAGTNYGPIEVTVTGTRDQMTPFIAEYLDEPVEMVRNAFSQWDGKDERDAWKLMGY